MSAPQILISHPNSPTDSSFLPSISPAIQDIKNALKNADTDSYIDKRRSDIVAADLIYFLPGIFPFAPYEYYSAGNVVVHGGYAWIAKTDRAGGQSPPGEDGGVTWKRVSIRPTAATSWLLLDTPYKLSPTIASGKSTYNLTDPIFGGVNIAAVYIVGLYGGSSAFTFELNTFISQPGRAVGESPFVFPVENNQFVMSNESYAVDNVYLLGYAVRKS